MKPNTVLWAVGLVMSSQAMAQSNVSLYGSLDLGLLSISNTSSGVGYLPKASSPGGGSVQLKDGGIGNSNWGLKGEEDLGGGLKALFQLQGNLKANSGESGGPNSSGGTSVFNQMATVGLGGEFGDIRIGRQVSPLYYALASSDARGARYFGSALTALVGLNSASGLYLGNNSNPAFGTIYNDNAVVYNAPTWNNLSLSAAYAFGNTPGSQQANSQQTLAALYSANGLKLSAFYYNGYGNSAPAAAVLLGSAAKAEAAGFTANANTNRLASLGGMYTRGAYTVSASWMGARNPVQLNHLVGGADSLDLWSVGAAWRVAPLANLSAGYYRIKDNTHAGNTSTQFALGLDYFLSRRTTLYVEAAQVNNKGANMNTSPVYASPVAANKSVSAWMAGLRHSF